MKKSNIFIAGVAAGAIATGAYYSWKEYKCLELAMLTDPEVTTVEAQRLFAGCYVSVLRFTGKKNWKREVRERYETRDEKYERAREQHRTREEAPRVNPSKETQ